MTWSLAQALHDVVLGCVDRIIDPGLKARVLRDEAGAHETTTGAWAGTLTGRERVPGPGTYTDFLGNVYCEHHGSLVATRHATRRCPRCAGVPA